MSNLMERLGRIDVRILYLLLVIVLMWPLIRPIGLPISVSHYTKTTFSVIDTLQPGDKVIMDVGYTVAGAGDVESQTVAILRHLFERGVKVIFVGFSVEGPMIIESTLMPMWEARGKVYGEDFVNLGYLAGLENAIATWARDIKMAYPTCFRGLSTSNLPILEGVNDASAVKMFLFFTASSADQYVRQIAPYGVPIIGGLISTITPQAEPYVHSGQLAGILSGLRGGAEYEVVSGMPGPGVASMDAQSTGHMLIIAFILFANVSYLAMRSSTRGPKGVDQR